MARQIIILENQNPGRATSEPLSYRFAFWLSVPAARQASFARLQPAVAVSAVATATAGELTAIQTGAIREEVSVFSEPPGTTLAQIEAALQAQFTIRQSALNSAAENPWDHYNSSFDGSTWTIVTVA